MILQLLMSVGQRERPASSGCAIGDSTVAANYPPGIGILSVASYTLDLMPAGSAINDISFPGDTINQQLTAWSALPAPTKAAFDWVICEIGLNDVDPAVSLATTVSHYQTMVNTIRADNATCKIIAATMTPCKGR